MVEIKLPLDVDAFLAAPAEQWAEQAVHLLELQSRWGVSQVPGTSESAWHLESPVTANIHSR
jgi:hypothetical protein